MLPLSTWREVYRIKWVSNNNEAVRFLSDVFYLLMALYRQRRFQEFNRLQRLYFMMIDSFAQYGRAEAKDTMDRLLEIPWFNVHRRYLDRLIAAHHRVITEVSNNVNDRLATPDQQMEMNRHVAEFFYCLKQLTHFDDKDEARIQSLVENEDTLNALLENVYEELDVVA